MSIQGFQPPTQGIPGHLQIQSDNELKELGAQAALRNEWDVVEQILEKGINLSHLQMEVLEEPHFMHHADKVCKMIDSGVVSPKAMIVIDGEKRPLLDLAIELKNFTKLATELLDRGCPQIFINSKAEKTWLLTEFESYRLNKEMKDLLISRAYGQEWLLEFKWELNCLLLINAVNDPDSDTVKSLIRLGADVNFVNTLQGLTILASAAVNHELDKLEMLRAHGAQLVTTNPQSLIGLGMLVNKYSEDKLRELFKDVPPEYLTFNPENLRTSDPVPRRLFHPNA